MNERLYAYINRFRPAIELALDDYLPASAQAHAHQLNEAIRYALFPGGKRWRPILTLLGAAMTGADPKNAMPAACAMEYLHTSSIIIDDLPVMDDAPIRRGRDATHLVFGESVAILAALALLNESYSLLARNAGDHGSCESAERLVTEAARCIGSNGMIGGQLVDLVLQGVGPCADALFSQCLKTTALMRLTMIAGAVACGADEKDVAALGNFGESLGLAYQICDDLQDELGSSHRLGKPVKQDFRHCRVTHVAEFGVEGARSAAARLVADAEKALRVRFGVKPEVEMLSDAANLILQTAVPC
jgi:geranylgeranyl diphosphate synthase type II